jgi:hypothetical protein
MIIKPSIIIALSCSFYEYKTPDLDIQPYESYTVNRIITTQDMYNTTELIEKIFMQEEK